MYLSMKSLALSIKPLFFLSVLLLSACGGGGGGTSAPDNLAPTITSANFQVEQDSDLTATISATDPEGDTVTFSQTSEPDNGEMVSFAANGEFTYRPNAGFIGSDSFTVSISDGTNQVSATITVNILEVAPTNQAPTVTSANFELDQDTSLTATLTATDPEGDTVTFTVNGDPTNGQLVSFDSNGAFTYTPNGGFTGSDSFNIVASDGTNQVDATITLNVLAVNPVNEAPTITTANFEGNQDTDLIATITASDPEGDTVTFAQTSEPSSGSMMAFAANGNFTYRPNTGFVGTDSFTITASDGENEITATISITIFEEVPTNEPPTITSGNFEGNQDTDLSGIITASDPEGDTVTFTQTSEPSSGSMMAFVANGNFTYRPNAGFVGTDSFTIAASDGVNEVAATITLNVLEVIPPNEAPTITSANFEGNQDTDLIATITASDPEGDTVTFTQTSEPSSGSMMAFAANGNFTYRPNAGFVGTDSFTIAASDGVNEIAATITLNVLEVIPPNEAPIFTSASTANVDENTSGVVYTATATDADGDDLTFSISGGADQGVFSINATSGQLTLTNPADFEAPSDANADGVYEVTLNVEDGNGGSSQLNLSLTVVNINEAPAFTSGSTANVDENTSGVVYTATATDADGDDLTFSISGGADQGAFSLNGNRGELTLTTAADFESPGDANTDGVFEVTLNVEDGNGGSSQLNLSLTVININEAPSFTSASTANVDENTSGLVYTATATDADGDDLTFSISGGADQGAFSIDGSSGELTLTTAADFEAPSDANTDGVYEVTLNVEDDTGSSDQLALALTVEDVTQLQFKVSYPTPNANLGGDVEFTSVTGVIEDLEDGEVLESDINFISVNGQGADIELPTAQDNTTRWRTQLPVTTTPNSNTLNIELADNSNNNQLVSQLLLNRPLLSQLQSMVLDSANNRALVLDSGLDALVAIDLDSGDRSILSDDNTGAGTNLIAPVAIELDSANNRALVLDNNLDALIAIDLDSGDRSILSDDNTGAGSNLIAPVAIELDSANNRALVIDISLGALIAINLDTGNRNIISDANIGTGSNLIGPRAVVLDSANNRALVLDSNLDALVAIDLDTGNRTILSDANTGIGINLQGPDGVTLDSTNNRVLVTDNSLSALLEIDLGSGNRTVVSDNNTGDGASLLFPMSVALDSTNNRALVLDFTFDALLAIDLDSGNRSLVSDSSIGIGSSLIEPGSIALDGANNRALVLDSRLNAIFAIDLDNGNRTIISDENIGVGVTFNAAQSIALDALNNRLLLIDTSLDALFAVNLDTGDRSVISDVNAGTGVNLSFPRDIVLDSTNNQALVIDSRLDALFAIDLANGNRTVISDANTGTGVNLSVPQGITLDSANNRALVVDITLDALIAIDLDSGDRVILSDANTGIGPDLRFPEAVALDNINNRALVVDSALDALVAIDLGSGDRIILSDNNTGTGSNLINLEGLALDSTNNRALVLTRPSIVVIELTTGERAVGSKGTLINIE
jgi:Big-like domain-containing protein